MSVSIKNGKIVFKGAKLSAAEVAKITTHIKETLGDGWAYDSHNHYLTNGSNTVSLEKYSFEQAVVMLKSLKDCRNCHDCYQCTKCISCVGCVNSTQLNKCFNVVDSDKMINCEFCENCYDCRNCSNLKNAQHKKNLHESLDESKDKYYITSGNFAFVFDNTKGADLDYKFIIMKNPKLLKKYTIKSMKDARKQVELLKQLFEDSNFTIVTEL